MIFDPSSVPHLKPWLVRTLEPICDAEPGALADYILALLKHNVPESEMRKELAVQLDEFLEKAECASFIDTLFTVLRTKSYLPYGATPSSPSFASKPLDNGIPIPLDGLLNNSMSTSSPERTRKRSVTDDERDGRPPAKGPRLNSDGQFSRYGNGNSRADVRSTGGWGGRVERPPTMGYRDTGVDGYGLPISGGMGMNGGGPMNGRRPQAYHPPDQKRGICRDYHNNGYCARGAMCKYSHGDDAVVPGQLYPMNGPTGGMPFVPMFPGAPGIVPFGPSAAYDPHEARMDIRPPGRPHQRAPLLPRIQQEDGSRVVHPINASGELPVIQDLTPSLPPDSTTAQSEPQSHPQFHSSHQQHIHQQPHQLSQMSQMDDFEYGVKPGSMNGHKAYMPMGAPMDVEVSVPETRGSTSSRGNFRGRGGAGGGGRGRGTFGGEVHNFRPERRNDKTLVVEKIPEDKLSLDQVNGWFKRFGTVTNVAIDSMNAKALVSFSTHEDAHVAWKSEDAVFGNRFVKVFWHRPMEGHGQVGARMLAASAPLVANITAKEAPSRPTPAPLTASASSSSATGIRKTSITPSATATALAAKQQLLEQQIAEQKSLMASLTTASAEEKKTIMARLRKLGEEMITTPAMPTPVPSPTIAKNSTPKLDVHERKERERLDKELEMHSAVAEGEDNSEDLKAKLERLKAEAASLGIADTNAEQSWGGSYRGYRGRGRGGRSYFRGATVMRGGPPRASMKLDNRPKKLLVKGVREEGLQALRDWYETTGQMEAAEQTEGGDVIVSFKSRASAEQGLAKGSSIPTVGSVQITWYTGKQGSNTAPAATPKPTNLAATPLTANTELGSPETPESLLQEEEVVASGWGGDGDDGDGMGML